MALFAAKDEKAQERSPDGPCRIIRGRQRAVSQAIEVAAEEPGYDLFLGLQEGAEGVKTAPVG
jgi:hypothetical protein